MRASLIVAIAALSVMVFGASNARAAAFTTEIDDAALKIPGFAAFDILSPPAVSTLSGDIVTGTGEVTAGDLVFPTFSTGPPDFPIALSVALNEAAPITGDVTAGTGMVTTDSSTYTATVSLAGGPDCVYTFPMAFSTEPVGQPIAGDRFIVDTTAGGLAAGPPPMLGAGVLSVGWASLPPAPDPIIGPPDECAALNGLTGGAGGLALGQGVDITPPAPPVPAVPAVPATPAPKKCKKGQKLKKGKCVKKKKKKK